MDRERMLEMCRRGQWKLTDLDWSRTPRTMSADDEEAVVQLFMDMAGVERLAGELFREQERRVADPTLKAIFRTFVADEMRHAAVAERLAGFYDTRRLRTYTVNPHLARFVPHFLAGIRVLSDDVANAYVTGGELILDVALLRSVNDHVADAMSAQAMELINRDESRHIAVDYAMLEHYASPAYAAQRASRARRPVRERARAAWTFANMLYYAAPMIRAVFTEPMSRIDPGGRRLREAFKRMQLLAHKPGLAELPFNRFLGAMQDIYVHPLAGRVLGGVAARLVGVDGRFLDRMYDAAEAERARRMSFDELAQEALAAKHSDRSPG
jgi:hypothetical protein